MEQELLILPEHLGSLMVLKNVLTNCISLRKVFKSPPGKSSRTSIIDGLSTDIPRHSTIFTWENLLKTKAKTKRYTI
jgi:hypothetical protein